MSHPNDPPPQPAPKHVAPYLILLIVLGILTPFAVNYYRTSQLAANEQAAVRMLRSLAKAQDAHFAAHKEFAPGFVELGGEFAALPEMDDSSGGSITPAHVEDPSVQSGSRKVASRNKTPAWHGYRFRMLKGTSGADGSKSFLDESGKMTRGFAVLAVPDRYGFSGKDTFFLKDQELYAKDFEAYTDRVTQTLFHFALPQGAQKIP